MEKSYAVAEMLDVYGSAVMQIFNHYVTTDFAAYFETAFPDAFFARLKEQSRGYPSVVALDDRGKVVGFGFLHAYHPAPAFRRTAEVTYFLAPEHTRKGIGGMILGVLIRQARQQGIERLLASISSLNPDSLAFHVKHGFEEVGRLKSIGRKFDRDFDVVYMQRILATGD
jgi:phosphinothricin acetyltransferase